MYVIDLDRKVNDPKPLAHRFGEGAHDFSIDGLPPQARQSPNRPHGDMDRMSLSMQRPYDVRDVAPSYRLAAPSPSTRASPGSKLDGWVFHQTPAKRGGSLFVP